MKKEILQSIKLMESEYSFFKWSIPLIESLENRERHIAILWVIECLIWVSEHWSNSNKSQSQELLQKLKQLVKNAELDEKSKTHQINEIQKTFNSLWFHNENRDSLITAVANCYAAEGSFLLGNYRDYRKRLVLLMGFGFKDDQKPEFFKSFYTESIKKYEEIDW